MSIKLLTNVAFQARSNELKCTILYSIVFTDFQLPKLHPFQNLSLRFILNKSLKFRKFQLRYSYKTQYKETGCNKQ